MNNDTNRNDTNDEFNEPPIILFDGMCQFCSGSVQFIIKRDPKSRFRFAHLQSEFGQKQLKKFEITNGDALSSIVLIDQDHASTKSTAALRIAKGLKQPWPLLYGLIIVPKFIRDWLYDFIGDRRYRWFGKHRACWLPDDERLKDRFINQ